MLMRGLVELLSLHLKLATPLQVPQHMKRKKHKTSACVTDSLSTDC